MTLQAPFDHHRPSVVDNSNWRALAWFGVALQVLAAIVARWSENLGDLWIILGFLAGSVVFLLATRRLPSLLAFVVILASVINAGGWAWNWYDAFAWFDELVHTYNPFAIVAVLMFWSWRAGSVTARPASGKWVILAAGSGPALGVAWEIVEAFFIDLRLQDTIVGLVLDTIGASLGGWLSGWVIQLVGKTRHAH